MYCSLKTMAKKFIKYIQIKSILMHQQNTPMYYAKYKKEENNIKALMELIKGVAVVTITEEKV